MESKSVRNMWSSLPNKVGKLFVSFSIDSLAVLVLSSGIKNGVWYKFTDFQRKLLW